jgi:hypothetical protein
MPNDAEPQQNACMFCVKQFPIELKAEMKARAAVERKSLRDWLVERMRHVVATPAKKAVKPR